MSSDLCTGDRVWNTLACEPGTVTNVQDDKVLVAWRMDIPPSKSLVYTQMYSPVIFQINLEKEVFILYERDFL